MLFASLTLCAGFMASCSEDDTDQGQQEQPPVQQDEVTMALEVAEVNAGGATLKLTTKGIAKYAYTVYEQAPAEQPMPVVVFHEGTTGDCADGDNSIAITGKQPQSTYYVCVAGQTSDNSFFEEVLSAEFTTTNLEEMITLMEQYYDGYSVYVNLPAEVKERGNVVRFGTCDIAFYAYLRNGGLTDAEILTSNGGQFFGDDEESYTITYNTANTYLCDEDGVPIKDEYDQMQMIHNPIVPGEPAVIIMGEFGHGRHEEFDEEGFYGPMFDYEAYYNSGDEPVVPLSYKDKTYTDDAYWTGFHTRYYVSAKQPEKLDAKLNVTIEDISAVNATIRINPDPEIKLYSMMILEDYVIDDMMKVINDDESLLQWFVTSYFGYMSYNGISGHGPMEYVLRDLYTTVDDESNCEVLIVGMSDDMGSAQCFERHKFKTGQKTQRPPVVEVKHISAPAGEDESPYYVWFNIKCTNGNAAYGKYAADYAAEWGKMNTQGYSNTELIKQGFSFSGSDIEDINSPAGLNVAVATLDGMTTRMGVLLYNAEDTPNNPDDKASEAMADATSPYIEAKERVESSLFTDLEGEWTLTATAVDREYTYENTVLGEWVWYELAEPVKTKVTISNGAKYPEVLPEEVYKAYASLNKPLSKEEVDKLYAGFCAEADAYNDYLRGQNRLLCVGMNSACSVAAPMSAFEGFYVSGYNSYDNASIFYDFGPKWYLEIDKDGNLTAPFDANHFRPASNWTQYPVYMGAVAADESNDARIVGADGNALHFPVEVSADKNTITINPLTINGKEFYPNVVYSYWGQMSIGLPKYNTKWTLTRGWNEQEEAAPASRNISKSEVGDMGGAELRNRRVRQLSRTVLTEPVKYGKGEITPVSLEESKARIKKYVEERYGIKK